MDTADGTDAIVLGKRKPDRSRRRLADEPTNGVYGSLKALAMVNGYGDKAGATNVMGQVEPVADTYYMNSAQVIALYSRDAKSFESLYNEPVIAAYVESDSTWGDWTELILGEAYLLLGDRDKGLDYLNIAKDRFEQRVSGFEDSYYFRQGLAETNAYLGNCDAAFESISRARTQMPESKDSIFGVYVLRSYAKVLMNCGKTDAALDQLEHQLAVPAGTPVWNLKLSPEWDPLREHPRFKAMIAESKDETGG